MKKLMITLAALLATMQLHAQGQPLEKTAKEKIDTIYVTHGEMIYVIMPAEIHVHAFGTAEIEARKAGRILFMRSAQPRVKPTSVLINYGQDEVFKGVVVYRNKVIKPFYDYSSRAAVAVGSQPVKDTVADNMAKRNQLAKLKASRPSENRSVKSNGIKLELTHLGNDEEATYLAFQLSNESSLIYTIDYVSFSYDERVKKKRNNSLVPQQQELEPVAMIAPDKVESGQSKQFLYALPLYSPNDESRLIISVREAKGNRTLQLAIPAKEILTAKLLKNHAAPKSTVTAAQSAASR